MNNYERLYKNFPIIMIAIVPLTSNAQKLPNIQTASLRAPDNIKIDGKTTEWNDKFQAYNTANRFFYTLSNDDDNLYLSLSTNDEYVFSKIMYGGITLTIQLPVEKTDKRSTAVKNVAITYPPIVKPLKGPIIDIDKSLRRFVKNNDTTKIAPKKKLDSLCSVIDDKMNNLFKEIRVEGIDDVQDTLISIYNSEGMKVSAHYNSRLQYVYELAIPLKYLGVAIKSGVKFRYNIKLSGRPESASHLVVENPMAFYGPDYLYVYTPSDFWGVYNLAKK